MQDWSLQLSAAKWTHTTFFGDLFAVSSSGTVAELDELDSYMATASSDTSDDILAFWRDKLAVWPKLSAVVRCILAIPATDTSSERVFSLAGGTVEERRTQLSADAVDDLLFVHGLKK